MNKYSVKYNTTRRHPRVLNNALGHRRRQSKQYLNLLKSIDVGGDKIMGTGIDFIPVPNGDNFLDFSDQPVEQL